MTKPRKSCSYVDEWKSQWEPDLEAIGYNGNSCDPTKVDPKVLRWVKDSCADQPHFIKVINNGAAYGRPGLKSRYASCSITVPAPFVREHFRKLGRVASLENEDGRTWRVSFGKPKRDPEWMQGWDRFTADNDLKPGDVVVFVLIANSHFRFTLFDEDGNITDRTTSTLNAAAVNIETRCSSQESHEAPFVSNPDEHPNTRKRALVLDDIQSSPEAKYGERDQLRPAPKVQIPTHKQIAEPSCKELKLHTEEANPIPAASPSNTIAKSHEPPLNSTSTKEHNHATADNTNSQKLQQISSLDPFAFTFKSKRRPTTPAERQSAMDAAMAHASVLPEHYFVAVMSEIQLFPTFYFVIPDSFVTRSCFPTSTINLIIMDCEGKQWEMRSKQNKLNDVAFHCRFWALFALHNFLEEGDVCVFHLKYNIPSSPIILQVQIFRVLPISGRESLYDHFEMHKI